MLIDFGRQQKLTRIVPHQCAVSKLHDGEAIIKRFEGGFLSFASQNMTEHEDRLPLALNTKILQCSLHGRRAGKLTS
ncbi:MAG: hypothetical protein IPM58_02225 [Nitrospira sp.]|nr:hypothetical protein [Nitrospira sp.]